MRAKISEKTKKNLLDLKYHEMTMYLNTSLIIFSTYALGIAVSIVVGDMMLTGKNLFLSAIGLIIVGCSCILAVLKCKSSMKRIKSKIRDLEV